MTKEEIKTLIGTMKKQTGQDVSLIETHISWVILEGSSVYKIKKPMQYFFWIIQRRKNAGIVVIKN